MAVVWIWDAVMMVQHNHITRARKKENLCGYPRCNAAAIRATCGLFCSRVEGQDGYVACMASDCAPRLKPVDYMAPEEIKNLERAGSAA